MPPLFYSGKLRQTLFNVYVAKDKHLQINYRREMLTLPDGGSVSLDWASPSANRHLRGENDGE